MGVREGLSGRGSTCRNFFSVSDRIAQLFEFPGNKPRIKTVTKIFTEFIGAVLWKKKNDGRNIYNYCKYEIVNLIFTEFHGAVDIMSKIEEKRKGKT